MLITIGDLAYILDCSPKTVAMKVNKFKVPRDRVALHSSKARGLIANADCIIDLHEYLMLANHTKRTVPIDAMSYWLDEHAHKMGAQSESVSRRLYAWRNDGGEPRRDVLEDMIWDYDQLTVHDIITDDYVDWCNYHTVHKSKLNKKEMSHVYDIHFDYLEQVA